MTQTSCIAGAKIKTVAALVLWCLLFSTVAGTVVHADNGKPDLTVVSNSIVVTPDDIFENDQVKINFTVKNAGSAAAHDIGIALYINSRSNPVDELTLSSLDAGEEKKVVLYWIARPVGNHTFFIFLDFNEQISEVSEDNNIGSGTLNVKQPVYPPFPPEPENAPWWNPAWHYRVPVTVTMLGQREGYTYKDKTVYCTVDFTQLMDVIAAYQPSGGFSQRTFSPASVRVVRYERVNDTWRAGEAVGREIIFNQDYDATDKANVTLMWVMQGDILPHEARHYYLYWDTVENGPKSGAFNQITSGLKNAEFEDSGAGVWRNDSKPVLPVPGASDIMGWDMGYVDDPVGDNDLCYRLHRKGFIWQQDEYYAKVYQSFPVPDGGKGASYFLNAHVYFDADWEGVEWQIAVDGQVVERGHDTQGWLTLRKNVTTLLEGKTSYNPTFSFTVTTTETTWGTTPHEVSAYIDSCWIEVTPNPSSAIMVNESHGWWGELVSVADTYVAGVEGMDTLTAINVSAIAHPREVIAELYSPQGQFVTSSLPLPDAGFEGGADYTYLFHSNEQTTSASFADSAASHTGSRAVELQLSDYTGQYKFLDQPVQPEDMAGLRQSIAQGVHASRLPSLWFWYKVDQYDALSELEYTLLVEGGPNKFLSISMGALTKDGAWHRYDIPPDTLSQWKAGAGTVVGIEIRLVAKVESGENLIYIDDLGYAFMPSQDGVNRKAWHLDNLYTFKNGSKTGAWRLDITMADGSGYIVVRSERLTVEPAANLDVSAITAPDTIREGKDTTITVTVKNQGAKSVPSTTPINVSLTLYQGDGSVHALKMVKALAGLPAGASRNLSFTWQASYGDPVNDGIWTVRAHADQEKNIPDSDRENNWNILIINVIPLPDLQVRMSDLGFEPSHPTTNDTVNISAIIRNIGYNDTLAHIRFYIKEQGSRTYTLLPGGAMEEIIPKRDYALVTLLWRPTSKGTFSIKVAAACEDESHLGNNQAVKDIRVGGSLDTQSPFISLLRIEPNPQFLGEPVNISAVIVDNQTTVDKARVVISDGEDVILEEYMWRLGDTDVFYYNTTFSQVGYFTCHVQAWDTAGTADGTEFSHQAISDSLPFRIVYQGVETTPPSIRAVAATPQRQVIYGTVNISALVNDSSGLHSVTLYVTREGSTLTFNMSRRGTSDVYYMAQPFDEMGTYEYYVEAVDASANRNRNDTQHLYRYFTIPADYDGDDVPDTVEIEAGSNPRDGTTTVNVSIGGEIGYLLWREDEATYVYWDREDNEVRSVEETFINDHQVILFDTDGDGAFDHSYDTASGTIEPYEEVEEAGWGDSAWVIPAVILFAIICLLFIAIRKRS